MWQLMFFILIGPAAPQPDGAAQAAVSSCVQCHQEMDGELKQPVLLSAEDIHFKNGLSCHSCHGGDPAVGVDSGGPEDAMNPAKGYIGRPARKTIAALCASCHSKLEIMRQYNPQARVDQYTEYVTSVHGKKYLAGDTKVATCIDCHGAHGIRAVSDPNSRVYAVNVASTCARCHSNGDFMAEYGIPTDQMKLYSESVHGEALIKNRDISAPTCNDCHGNHGAVPPGVDSVANVCGQCHVSQWDLFGQSPHKPAFSEYGFPACVTCHEHHLVKRSSDAMLGVEEPSVCINCHDAESPGYAAAKEMKGGIVALSDHLDAARAILEKAERAGMEVSAPIYQLSEGRDRLVRARVEIHRFDPGALREVLAEGGKIAAASEKSGFEAMEELAYRRKGLAVSVVILLAMICLIVLKIRQIGHR